MSDDLPRAAGVEPPTIIRVACIVLLVAGFFSVSFTLPAMVDAAGTRCHLARAWIDQANTDQRIWNDVDTKGRKASKLPCADAIELAARIPLNEKATRRISVPGEGAVRIEAGLSTLVALGQAGSGWLVLRQRTRSARNAAIGFSAFGIILRPLGIMSAVLFVFVAYAFAISAASRELWPKEAR
jgi:hypothetical protein